MVVKEGDGSKYIRHPDDIKVFRVIFPNTANEQLSEQNDIKGLSLGVAGNEPAR